MRSTRVPSSFLLSARCCTHRVALLLLLLLALWGPATETAEAWIHRTLPAKYPTTATNVARRDLQRYFSLQHTTIASYSHYRRSLSVHGMTTPAASSDNNADETTDTRDTGRIHYTQSKSIPGTDGGGRADRELGGYDPSERIGRGVNVGDPQIKFQEKERSVTSILKELAAIQQQGPQKYCILGTRHCSYLHQQIIELLAYALVLSGNHVYTSGAGGTHAATIRGGLRAERPDLLTVVLPQSMAKQPKESQELLRDVDDVIAMPENDDKPLDLASRICNSYLLSQTDQLISFAFHESTTVIEATKEAKKLEMLVTVLYLD